MAVQSFGKGGTGGTGREGGTGEGTEGRDGRKGREAQTGRKDRTEARKIFDRKIFLHIIILLLLTFILFCLLGSKDYVIV